MKIVAVLLVSIFALSTVSMGMASAKTMKQDKSFFTLPIIGKYLVSHPEDWPTTPYRPDTPEMKMDHWPTSPYRSNTPDLMMDDWPTTPYRPDTPDLQMDDDPLNPWRTCVPHMKTK